MQKYNLCKFHGFGNDYIVMERSALEGAGDLSEFARRICDRHTGVGGDGIAVLEKLENSADADYFCEIINPDGSIAGFSGNGTRCAVAYLYHKNLWSDDVLRLETKSGVKNFHLLERGENAFRFLAELGKPSFELPETPQNRASRTENEKEFGLLIPSEEIAVRFTYVDVGNPVAVVFVDDFEELAWRRIGKIMESSTDMFPERTNVVFVKILDAKNIEIRIWERGAGETSSSGTCSIAAAVASAFTGKTGREVSVIAPGGTTEAVWRETDGEMMITGRADLVFSGEYFMS
jgi:diaminopimelate epimerase